jgi:hypothetical protein
LGDGGLRCTAVAIQLRPCACRRPAEISPLLVQSRNECFCSIFYAEKVEEPLEHDQKGGVVRSNVQRLCLHNHFIQLMAREWFGSHIRSQHCVERARKYLIFRSNFAALIFCSLNQACNGPVPWLHKMDQSLTPRFCGRPYSKDGPYDSWAIWHSKLRLPLKIKRIWYADTE